MAFSFVQDVMTLTFMIIFLFVHQSESVGSDPNDPLYRILPQDGLVNCSQCNMRLRNVNNLCDNPRQMINCIGCMKTITKVKIRDSGYINGWERVSEVTSRYCIRPGNMNLKDEGCYKQTNNGGYTERCYCYSHNCNSRGHRFDSRVTSALTVASVAAVIVSHLCRT